MPDAPKYYMPRAKINKLIDTFSGTLNEYNFAPEKKQSLAEAAAEIQQLLEQLAKTYPTTTAEAIQKEIRENPTFKARLLNLFKEGAIETLKMLFPPIGIPIEMVRGWLEAE